MPEGKMIEVKTAELIGPALDWAVAKAAGVEVEFAGGRLTRVHDRQGNWLVPTIRSTWSPSTDWSQGGPLLDAHCKGFGCVQDGREGAWRAFGYGSGQAFDPSRTMRLAGGPSILIAACRAIVAAKLGDTVQVPAELIGGGE